MGWNGMEWEGRGGKGLKVPKIYKIVWSLTHQESLCLVCTQQISLHKIFHYSN